VGISAAESLAGRAEVFSAFLRKLGVVGVQASTAMAVSDRERDFAGFAAEHFQQFGGLFVVDVDFHWVLPGKGVRLKKRHATADGNDCVPRLRKASPKQHRSEEKNWTMIEGSGLQTSIVFHAGINMTEVIP